MPTDPRRAAVTTDDTERIIGVVVTHKRRELLATSLDVLAAQTRPLDHLETMAAHTAGQNPGRPARPAESGCGTR